MKKIIGTIVIAFCTSILTFAFAKKIESNEKQTSLEFTNTPMPDGENGYTNLEDAAEKSSKAVVHIKTETNARQVQYQNPFGGSIFDQFFGQQYMQQGPQESSGSGVVVSADGYIVTNNHVIDGADQIKVVFNNKKTVSAKLIGKDASTDLAVLKVDENNLSFIQYGNSDDVRLGQWVLAVGYPLTLETTVTAGIVSAKYRNIGINQQKSGNNAIESFIQTDAAVNPGNSGGALVNARGELIGINSAIASPTGSYAGYSFAIPSNIVKKVVNDMMKFGNVQRAYLGVGYLDTKNATPEQMSAYHLEKIEGIYINQIMENSSAEDAGLKVGDVITKIGNNSIKSGPQMLEKIAQYRPGESISINYIRNGKAATTTAKLKNVLGNTQIVKNEPLSKEKLGVQMRDLTSQEAGQLGIKGGIYITGILQNGLIAKQTRMKKGFVMTQVNEQAISSIKELEKILQSEEKDFQLGGLYPNYQGLYYYEIKAE
jgi:Do/DeqQ family serine protease